MAWLTHAVVVVVVVVMPWRSSTGYIMRAAPPAFVVGRRGFVSSSPPFDRLRAAAAAAGEISIDLPEERGSLSIPERLSRSLRFYSRVIPILLRYQVKEVELRRRCATDEECDVEYEALDEWGSDELRDAIMDLQGFYVKSGQVISSRVDLFAKPYTEKLSVLQDGLEPISTDVVKEVVRRELKLKSLGELFESFDDEPLGCASIAQVHKATLLDGRKVAVKVQRPGARPLLEADLANLKRFSKLLADALPVDYYTVFSELGDALDGELDFLNEVNSMDKLRAALAAEPGSASGSSSSRGGPPPPVKVPRAIAGLSSRRVLTMEFVEGVPLKRLGERTTRNPAEAKYAGAKIVNALGEAYARMIFNGGHLHGDPHPANVFVNPETLEVTLLDCGQTKQLSLADREQLRAVILHLQAYRRDPSAATLQALANDIRDFGVELRPREGTIKRDDDQTRGLEATKSDSSSSSSSSSSDRREDDDACLAAVALLLFGDKASDALPGGYDDNELGPNSPLRRLRSFPQSLVLLGRAAVLIRGIAAKLDVPYSLADAWEEAAKKAHQNGATTLPPWADETALAPSSDAVVSSEDLRRTFRRWLDSKAKRLATKLLPRRVKTFLAARAVRRLEARRPSGGGVV